MTVFKKTLIFSDMLGLILPLIWVVYHLTGSTITEFIFNFAIVLVLLYSSFGNLFYLFNKEQKI